mmetsp:Transcript_22252/g.77988  ORF Transcript_22252/g.77988 Transcript_22252/m.77988 type:complete len:210 (-) Transcript_22252:103-732(-)
MSTRAHSGPTIEMRPATGATLSDVPMTSRRSAASMSSLCSALNRGGRLSPKKVMAGLVRPPHRSHVGVSPASSAARTSAGSAAARQATQCAAPKPPCACSTDSPSMPARNSRPSMFCVYTRRSTPFSSSSRRKQCVGVGRCRPACGHSSRASVLNGVGLLLKKSMSKTASGVGRPSASRREYRPVPGVRKSGMPADTDMPAPASTTTLR